MSRRRMCYAQKGVMNLAFYSSNPAKPNKIRERCRSIAIGTQKSMNYSNLKRSKFHGNSSILTAGEQDLGGPRREAFEGRSK